jgi:hypothetical protein
LRRPFHDSEQAASIPLRRLAKPSNLNQSPSRLSDDLYAGLGTLEEALLKAMAAMIMPRITLFHKAAPVANASTNGEIINQIPSTTLTQLHPGCSRVLKRMMARMPTTIPVATLFQIDLGNVNARTKGEIRTQMPKMILTQLIAFALGSAVYVCRSSFIFSSCSSYPTESRPGWLFRCKILLVTTDFFILSRPLLERDLFHRHPVSVLQDADLPRIAIQAR